MVPTRTVHFGVGWNWCLSSQPDRDESMGRELSFSRHCPGSRRRHHYRRSVAQEEYRDHLCPLHRNARWPVLEQFYYACVAPVYAVGRAESVNCRYEQGRGTYISQCEFGDYTNGVLHLRELFAADARRF